MPRPVPPLRPDLSPAAERVAGQPDRVICRGLDGGHHAWLERDWRLLMLADGRQSLTGILRKARDLGIDTDVTAARELFTRARAAGLLQDQRRRSRAHLAVMTWQPLSETQAALALEALPEARYRCEMCGESCRAGYEVGPVPLPLPIDLSETVPFPTATSLPSDEAPVPPPAPHLRRIDGACSQLDPSSQLCRIHTREGIDRKPRACKDFPIILSRTPTGLRLSLQWECTRLHRAISAAPVLSAAPTLPAHLPSSLAGIDAAVAPDALPLGDGRLIPFSRYAGVEAALLEAVRTRDPDRIAAGLPLLVASLSLRAPDLEPRLARLEEVAPEDLAEAFVLDAAPLVEKLHQQCRALAPFDALLAATDRRRLYRVWLETVLAGWRAGGKVALPPMERQDLWRAYLRNRLFGLGLLKAPSLFAGAVDIGLRYLVARSGLLVPLPVPLEGSPGAAENRRLVAVEHTLREERTAPVLNALEPDLRDWLEELL